MVTRALTVLAVVFPLAGLTQTFSYSPPGELWPVNGSPSPGRGRVDTKVYAPAMRFPIETAPAFLNSQVWGVGGNYGPSGSQCDARNFSYPWHDNYCESRSWTMPLCPSGTGHQGQDIRGASCADRTHWVVAVVDGTITTVAGYEVSLMAADGTRYRYLHMNDVAVRSGQTVKKGDRVGKVSNNFNGTPTTVHLHFDVEQSVSGHGRVFVPGYLSFVQAYQRLLGIAPDAGVPDAGGQVPDAGGQVPDAGGQVPDAGGQVPDAGGEVPDAGGEVPDAGELPPATIPAVDDALGLDRQVKGGCDATGGALGLLSALLVLARARRTARRR